MEIPGLSALHPPVSLIASHLCYTYHRLPSKLPTGSSIQQINLPSPWLYIYILYKTISNKNIIRSFRLSAFRTRPWRNWPLRTPWSPRRCIPRRAKSSTLSGRPVGTPPAGGNRLVGTCIGQQWCTWYLFVKWKVMITGWWDILGMFPSGKLT